MAHMNVKSYGKGEEGLRAPPLYPHPSDTRGPTYPDGEVQQTGFVQVKRAYSWTNPTMTYSASVTGRRVISATVAFFYKHLRKDLSLNCCGLSLGCTVLNHRGLYLADYVNGMNPHFRWKLMVAGGSGDL